MNTLADPEQPDRPTAFDPLTLRYDARRGPRDLHNVVAVLRNPCVHNEDDIRAARLAAADLIAAWLERNSY
jgi:hypothetical protein